MFEVIPISEFQASNLRLAVSCKNADGINHCGILYRKKITDSDIKFFHLAWHFLLKDDDANTDFFKNFHYVNCVPLDSENDPGGERTTALIAFIKRVYSKCYNSLPYAIQYFGSSFLSTGEFQLQQNEFGLSCATFVMAFFKSSGIILIDQSTWVARQEDIGRHQQLVNLLESNDSISEEHINNVKSGIGGARYRPEEVTASTTQLNPSTFNYCIEGGEYINNIIS